MDRALGMNIGDVFPEKMTLGPRPEGSEETSLKAEEEQLQMP